MANSLIAPTLYIRGIGYMVRETAKSTFRIANALVLLCLTFASQYAFTEAKGQKDKMKDYIRADAVLAIPTQKVAGFHSEKPSHDIGASIGLGRIFTDRIRGDITATFNQYLYSTGPGSQKGQEHNHLTSLSFMTNGYFHLTKDKKLTVHVTKISPYLMAGIGMTFNKLDDWSDEVPGSHRHLGDTSQNFAWQVGIGVLFNIGNNIDADLMYKYVDLGRTKTKNRQSDNMGTDWETTNVQSKYLRVHEISIGIFFTL